MISNSTTVSSTRAIEEGKITARYSTQPFVAYRRVSGYLPSQRRSVSHGSFAAKENWRFSLYRHIIGGIITGRSPTHAFRQATSSGGTNKLKTIFSPMHSFFFINTLSSVSSLSLCAIAQYEIYIAQQQSKVDQQQLQAENSNPWPRQKAG